ncbi:GH24 family phage-related lysozyme (muramidase) [Azospirillum baldaniorum]|uniref:lysozyme n=1 Tax=Azospirillum baldaniorum TaxID=1064539 RepID=UPI0011ABA8E7|nr:lysozyme [Azospirillum baldaniorum]TWA63688.1 GH24 family phage-related lysozyme (muramidase) [Azospirillum baldaniorum]
MTATLRAAPPPAALDLARHFEGLSRTAYRCPAGVWTIGYGHTQAVTAGDAITTDQAERLLAGDLAEAAAAVDAAVTVPLTDGQRAALIDFVFNVGPGRARKGKDSGKDGFVRLRSGKPSTLLRKLNAGDSAGAAAEFGAWVYGGGRVLPGLVRRRRAEELLFRGADWRRALDDGPMAQTVEPATPSVPTGAVRAAAGTLAIGGSLGVVAEVLAPVLQVTRQVQDLAEQAQGVATQAQGVTTQIHGLARLLGWAPSPAVAVLATGLVVTLALLWRARRTRG